MARLPRLNIPNIPQHVIQGGNNRYVCFYSDKDYAAKYSVRVHTFVLMTNHVHLLMTPTDMFLDLRVQPDGVTDAEYLIQYGQDIGVTFTVKAFGG